MDIVVAPSFPLHPPPVPIAIWLNRGDGTFYDGTAQVIDGAPPLTWDVNQILIGDFNGDGKSDLFILSAGADHAPTDGLSDAGYYNVLLLSQPNGKYKDASSQIAGNERAYAHQGGMADANGDGNLDVVVVNYRIPSFDGSGVKLFYGDGKGNFADATNALPPSIRHMTHTYGVSFQNVACATLADLDGDGKAEVITAGTGSDLAPNGIGYTTGSVRFHSLGADGTFVERARSPLPEALYILEWGAIPTNPTGPIRPSCSQILAGDFNGDGRTDLVVQWEAEMGRVYIEILRNDGNFQFTDITVDALGSYKTYFANGVSPAHHRLMDVNGDGTLDIVNQLAGVSIGAMLTHIAYLNDGTGHFTPWIPQNVAGPMVATDFLSASKCTNCAYLPLVFDTNKSGIASLVLYDFQSSVTTSNPSQTSAVYLTTFAPTNLSASTTQADCLFRWGESTYPTFFSPAPPTSNDLAPFRYRFYSQSNAYLGVSATDNRFYYVGPLTNNQLANLGPVAPWLSKARCN